MGICLEKAHVVSDIGDDTAVCDFFFVACWIGGENSHQQWPLIKVRIAPVRHPLRDS